MMNAAEAHEDIRRDLQPGVMNMYQIYSLVGMSCCCGASRCGPRSQMKKKIDGSDRLIRLAVKVGANPSHREAPVNGRTVVSVLRGQDAAQHKEK
jgi:hypothetical protein